MMKSSSISECSALTDRIVTSTVPLVRFELIDAPGLAYVKGADGVLYPVGIKFRTDDASLPYIVTVEVRVLSGKPVCKALEAVQRAGGQPVTRRGLNALPVDAIMRTALSQYSAQLEPSAADVKTLRRSTTAERDGIEARLRPARGRRGDEAARLALIRQVADMYRELVANGVLHPKPVIASRLGYSQSYIGSLVAKARRMKPPMLGAAEPGRAGDKQTKRSARGKGPRRG
jgi:hypothetical protein